MTTISKGKYVLLASVFTGLLTVFLYAVVTLFANLEVLLRPTKQHYAWDGTVGYIGDALFLVAVIVIIYGIFILLGFVVGGSVPFLVRK